MAFLFSFLGSIFVTESTDNITNKIMKTILSILAIALISSGFVSCRQDDVASDFEIAKTENLKLVAKNNNTSQNPAAPTNDGVKKEVDPDPPVKDGTSW